MRLHRSERFALLVAALVTGAAGRAQQIVPHAGYAYPAGGRQGTTFQVTVGGQYLDGVGHAYVTGAGVQARVLQYTKPLTPAQANALRERLQELRSKSDVSSLKEMAQIREKLAGFVLKPSSPAIAETVLLEVKVAADAEPGRRELRLGATLGLTNPIVFQVGALPEFTKRPVRRTPDSETILLAMERNPGILTAPQPPQEVTLPTMINGQLSPGGIDRYKFFAKKGQKLVTEVRARALIPYLPDAVPGWFQTTLTLYDARGKEAAFADDYRFHPDPVLSYEVPADGTYTIEIRDAIYRGREDFVYRIRLGELPFLTCLFPLGGRSGTSILVSLSGWNLPADHLTVSEKDATPGVLDLSVGKADRASNLLPFAIDSLSESLEHEPNDQPASAQTLTLPVIVNGRVDRPGDRDVYRIDGHAGDEIVAEVVARRLESPLDSVLRLTDASGRQLAFNDDHEDKGTGLLTHHADSLIRVTLPASATYYLTIGDTQRKGGSEYAYRLRVSRPRPDFALRVVPSGINVRAAATVPLTVHALRKDGFGGAIALALKDAPAGFKLSGGEVPAGQDRVRVTLTAPTEPSEEPANLVLEGRAKVGEESIVHTAIAADDMMQAFAYRHLVPATAMQVIVAGRGLGRVPTRLVSDTPVRLPAGGAVRVVAALPPVAYSGMVKVQLDLDEPPDGITIQDVKSTSRGTEFLVKCSGKVKPGLAGNLIVNVYAQRNELAAAKKKAQAPRRIPVSTLPAIPFEVVSGAEG